MTPEEMDRAVEELKERLATLQESEDDTLRKCKQLMGLIPYPIIEGLVQLAFAKNDSLACFAALGVMRTRNWIEKDRLNKFQAMVEARKRT